MDQKKAQGTVTPETKKREKLGDLADFPQKFKQLEEAGACHDVSSFNFACQKN